MLKFGNKEFRNLQEQVKKNMDDILFILQEEGVLNEFGIKVVGQEESVIDMPTVDDYKEEHEDWSYGDAYAVGTEAPYELYILTRANGTHPNDYWFNIGEFPVPGPQGEEGPEGPQGPQGPTGPNGQDGVSPQVSVGSVSATTLSASASATASVSMTGTYAQPVLNFAFGIPQGQDGETPSSIAWGNITGTIADQTDLVSALQGKANASALSSYATIDSLSVYALASVVSAMDYASVGALSSTTFIPTIGGTNDGTNWTTLTIDGETYGFAAGGSGGNAQWGSISGTLSDQLDLMSKFSEYAKIEDIPSLSGYATESWVSSNFLSEVPSEYATQSWVQSQNYITSSALSGYATEVYVQNSLSDYAKTSDLSIYALESELSLYATVSALSSYATVDSLSVYATISGLDSAISGVNSTIASLDYLSVGALSSETVIPDITGLASEGYVNSAISGLSSIYAYASDVASMNYASVHALSEDTVIPDITGLASEGYVDSSISALSSIYASISYVDALSSVYASKSELPNMSLYAELSASNTFTQFNTFPGINISGAGSIYNDYGALRLEKDDAKIGISNTMLWGLNTVGTIKFAAKDGIKLAQGNLLSNGVIVPNGSTWSGDRVIATLDDIPSVSGYAELNSVNTFTSGNKFITDGNGPDNAIALFSDASTVATYDAYATMWNGAQDLGNVALNVGVRTNYGFASVGLWKYDNDDIFSLVPWNQCDLGLNGQGWGNLYLNGSIYASASIPLSLPSLSGTLARVEDIPSTSEFAMLSGSNIWTGSNAFTTRVQFQSGATVDGILSASRISCSTYLDFGLGNHTYSIYADDSNGAPLDVYGGPGVQLRAYSGSIILRNSTYSVNTFEQWTFTLSDNTSVTKTILVG